MADKVELFGLVRVDHETIRSLFDQLVAIRKNDLKPDPKAMKLRRDLFSELRRELARHALFEEEMVYPLLRATPSSLAFARISVVQHAAADRLVTKLETTPVQSQVWESTVYELRDLMVEHMWREETELRTSLNAPKISLRKVASRRG